MVLAAAGMRRQPVAETLALSVSMDEGWSGGGESRRASAAKIIKAMVLMQRYQNARDVPDSGRADDRRWQMQARPQPGTEPGHRLGNANGFTVSFPNQGQSEFLSQTGDRMVATKNDSMITLHWRRGIHHRRTVLHVIRLTLRCHRDGSKARLHRPRLPRKRRTHDALGRPAGIDEKRGLRIPGWLCLHSLADGGYNATALYEPGHAPYVPPLVVADIIGR
jgi:hypothetical protein